MSEPVAEDKHSPRDLGAYSNRSNFATTEITRVFDYGWEELVGGRAGATGRDSGAWSFGTRLDDDPARADR